MSPPYIVCRSMVKVGTLFAGNACMTFALAFNGLSADAPRQRARCAATGRFVAWSKVPQLRVPGAPRVVVIPSTLVAVVDGAEVVPAAPVAEAPPVIGGVARTATVAGALAIGDGAPRGGVRAAAAVPPHDSDCEVEVDM